MLRRSPVRLKVAMERRSRPASPGAKSGADRWRSAWPALETTEHPGFLQRISSSSSLSNSDRRTEFDLLQSLLPPQIGMHHVALDRPGPDDRNFNHQVIKFLRLQPRQHRHLRAAFDLEHADGVGALTSCRKRRLVFVMLERGRASRHNDLREDRIRGAGTTACRDARTSTLRSPRASRSSLSHSMTVRSSIAAFSIGTISSRRDSVMTKPPTC